MVGTGENERDEWQSQGARIGWLDPARNLYLNPDASYKVAYDMGRGTDVLDVGQVTLYRTLRDGGFLVECEDGRTTVRKDIEGRRGVRVLHLKASVMSVDGEQEDDVPLLTVPAHDHPCPLQFAKRSQENPRFSDKI